MARFIREFPDGTFIEYDTYKFDDWCVFITRPGKSRFAPTDMDLLGTIEQYAKVYGNQRLYADYVAIYDCTGKDVDGKVLAYIGELCAAHYPERDAPGLAIWFTALYAAMIAEEHRAHTVLGKRIKRLGAHRLLVENASVPESANFMRGMSGRQISDLCSERGF
jgi:hypothetical protein